MSASVPVQNEETRKATKMRIDEYARSESRERVTTLQRVGCDAVGPNRKSEHSVIGFGNNTGVVK